MPNKYSKSEILLHDSSYLHIYIYIYFNKAPALKLMSCLEAYLLHFYNPQRPTNI